MTSFVWTYGNPLKSKRDVVRSMYRQRYGLDDSMASDLAAEFRKTSEYKGTYRSNNGEGMLRQAALFAEEVLDTLDLEEEW